MEQKKKIIGITGGVGAGKSSVLAVLKEDFGAKIILADLVAHDLMEPGSEGLKKVTEALGTSFLDPDGSVDRKALADVIFRNKDALRTMNSIIHPLVWKTMAEAAEAAEEQLVIIEAAVFDTAPKDLFDELWYVYTTKENRIIRLMANRGYSREKVRGYHRKTGIGRGVPRALRPGHRQQWGRVRYQTTAEGDP